MYNISRLDNLLSGAGRRLKRIQRADDKTKKRYLIILCSVCMLFVIGLWVVFLNLNIPRLISTEEKSDKEVSESSFWATLSRGFSEVTSGLGSQIAKTIDKTQTSFNDLKLQAQKKNEYAFTGSNPSLLFVDNDPVPKTILKLSK